eukprot:scaffold4273_cov215-Pinguiococcus_pyrenoidosus.AAC.4
MMIRRRGTSAPSTRPCRSSRASSTRPTIGSTCTTTRVPITGAARGPSAEDARTSTFNVHSMNDTELDILLADWDCAASFS